MVTMHENLKNGKMSGKYQIQHISKYPKGKEWQEKLENFKLNAIEST